VIEQRPTRSVVTVLPDTEHTAGVLLSKLAASPDEAVALMSKAGSTRARSVSGAKSSVWALGAVTGSATPSPGVAACAGRLNSAACSTHMDASDVRKAAHARRRVWIAIFVISPFIPMDAGRPCCIEPLCSTACRMEKDQPLKSGPQDDGDMTRLWRSRHPHAVRECFGDDAS
jgi:hypothetical protein